MDKLVYRIMQIVCDMTGVVCLEQAGTIAVSSMSGKVFTVSHGTMAELVIELDTAVANEVSICNIIRVPTMMVRQARFVLDEDVYNDLYLVLVNKAQDSTAQSHQDLVQFSRVDAVMDHLELAVAIKDK